MSTEQASPKAQIILGIFIVILVVVGFPLYRLDYFERMERLKPRNFKEYAGRVFGVVIENVDAPAIWRDDLGRTGPATVKIPRVEYVVNGQTYSTTAGTLRECRTGWSVRVAYKLDDPSSAVGYEEGSGEIIVMGLLALLLLVVALGVLARCIRRIREQLN
jgi:hypothetical protein